ncbi:phosphoglucosamine mutase [bacterium BMS3Bbin02]|nr:phosphoglucosamine mutase [bacterium BMS3Bbin02]
MGDSSQKLFGTDGVRGRANIDITVDLATRLARAATDKTASEPVLIGRDTRRSGPMIAAALHAGFNSVGVDTVDLGIIPVGGVSRLVRTVGARYGVMVSASHNPAPDNGIKFFGRDGAKLGDSEERAIEHRYFSDTPPVAVAGAGVGFQTTMADAVDRYVDYIKNGIAYSLRGLEFVLDTAHGAAFQAAPRLFRSLGAAVEVIGDQPTGMNINDGCGATHPEALTGIVNGRVGFSFDGDADRLIAIDEDGGVVDGDVILAIFAKHLADKGKLKNNVVVTTVMANLGFKRAMADLGIDVIETDVGDRAVLEAMRSSKAIVGGEQSGHVILEDRSTGDGLRTALRLSEVMASTGQRLVELRAVMRSYPQVLMNVTVESKSGWEANPAISAAITRATDALGNDGRILVRASGTEPLIRVMVEAGRETTANEIASSVADVVAAELS